MLLLCYFSRDALQWEWTQEARRRRGWAGWEEEEEEGDKIWFKWFQLLYCEWVFLHWKSYASWFFLSLKSVETCRRRHCHYRRAKFGESSSSSLLLHFCDSIDFIVPRIWVNFALFSLFSLSSSSYQQARVAGASEKRSTKQRRQEIAFSVFKVKRAALSLSLSLSLFLHSWLMHPSVYLASVSTVIWVRRGETTSSTRERVHAKSESMSHSVCGSESAMKDELATCVWCVSVVRQNNEHSTNRTYTRHKWLRVSHTGKKRERKKEQE